MIRSCFRQKIEIELLGIVDSHKRDFLDQNLPLFSILQAFSSPFMTQAALFLTLKTKERSPLDNSLIWIQLSQTLIYLICVFVPRTVNEWPTYSRIAPKFWIFLVTLLVWISPVLTAVYIGFNLGKVQGSPLKNWYFICLVT